MVSKIYIRHIQNRITPAIKLQCMGQCASSSAIGVCSDISKGVIIRFSTMPIKKSSILTGHVIEAIIRILLASFIVIAVAFLIGFRPSANIVEWFMIITIILLYILMISWISVFFGIKANSPEVCWCLFHSWNYTPIHKIGFYPC